VNTHKVLLVDDSSSSSLKDDISSISSNSLDNYKYGSDSESIDYISSSEASDKNLK